MIACVSVNELELIKRALCDYRDDCRNQVARVLVRLDDKEEAHEMARFFRQEGNAAEVLYGALESGQKIGLKTGAERDLADMRAISTDD